MGASILELGYLGVDFFFVLSGFIIYHSSQGKTIGEYSTARVRRVYLPYLPIGIGIALLYVAFPQVSANDREWSWLTTLTLLPLKADTALFVAWTLKHEILFYLVFAVLFFANRLVLGLAVWTVAIVISYFAGIGGIPLALINLEFVFGIIVAVLAAKGRGSPALLLLAPVPLIAWLLLGADRSISVLVGAGFALLLLPIVNLERAGRIHVPGWLLFLGAASYSIYLSHSIAISLVIRVIDGQHWAVILFAGCFAGVAAGIAYYLIVERPLLNLWPRRRVTPAPTVLPSGEAA